ncbi:unnamed protein product [Porites evermanni]|uniref:Uncharacterized protein n=1 Tax=Porites evermanni TaxID=104178 RepID=A0ABN8LMZ0_9CNID|nr:unnamed protein product [Porites evermanni]
MYSTSLHDRNTSLRMKFGLHRLPLDITSLETLLAKCVKTQTYRANSAITV